MHRRIGRKGIVAALGAAVYALFAACGWQVESAGSCNVPRALIMAAALFLPALLILWLLLRHGERSSHRISSAQGVLPAACLLCADVYDRFPGFLCI